MASADRVRQAGCPLCEAAGGEVVARNEWLRVVRTDEGGFVAFYRVIWDAHAAEFSDLSSRERMHCMDAVAVVEQALRTELAPRKINLASLGNAVPHLHWHVIARFDWDSHFPAPVWAAPLREPPASAQPALQAVLARRGAVHRHITDTLSQTLP